MSSVTSAIRSAKFQRRFFWVAVVIFAVGLGFGIPAIVLPKGHPTATPLSNKPPQVAKTPKSVKLDPAAKKVAQEFILTAVARKNLQRAYRLAGPQIRQGQTLKQWMTGDIAVIPYPVSDLQFAPMKIDYSYPKQAMIEVAMLPKKGSKVKGALFAMELDKIGKRWYVNSWVPASKPPVPCGGSGNC